MCIKNEKAQGFNLINRGTIFNQINLIGKAYLARCWYILVYGFTSFSGKKHEHSIVIFSWNVVSSKRKNNKELNQTKKAVKSTFVHFKC